MTSWIMYHRVIQHYAKQWNKIASLLGKRERISRKGTASVGILAFRRILTENSRPLMFAGRLSQTHKEETNPYVVTDIFVNSFPIFRQKR